jgi:hypothetical protein
MKVEGGESVSLLAQAAQTIFDITSKKSYAYKVHVTWFHIDGEEIVDILSLAASGW